MSPSNRRNPDKTDITGHFGWDVLTGRYKVRVTKKGCFKPKSKKVAFVDSREMDIPPPVTNLDLRLDCPDKVKPKLSAIKVKDRVLSLKVSEASTVKAVLERCTGRRCRKAKSFSVKAKFSKVLTFNGPRPSRPAATAPPPPPPTSPATRPSPCAAHSA